MAQGQQNFVKKGQIVGTPSFKRRVRLEKLAILESKLTYKDADIALLLGCSVGSIRQMKQTAEYRAIQVEIGSKVISEFTEQVNSDTSNQQAILDRAVPVALQNLFDLASRSTDERIKLSASTEILDRSGQHTKVSRLAGHDGGPLKSGINAEDISAANELVKTVLANSK